jgi:hypothetical protein
MRHPASDWLTIWLDELQSEQPDIDRSVQAIRHLTASLHEPRALQQWLAAIAHDEEDTLDCEACQAQLPDFLYAQQTPGAGDAPTSPRFAALRTHLAVCPFCATAYADVAEWIEASERDRIPVADAYPHFAPPFLAEHKPTVEKAPAAAWSVDLVEEAMAAGRRWAADTLGAVYVLLGAGPRRPAAAWAVKSVEGRAPLARTVLSEDEIDGWEIEVSAAIVDGERCLVEVAVYSTAAGATAEGIAVTLGDGTMQQTALTDREGIVQFEIPCALLDQAVVRVALDSSPAV